MAAAALAAFEVIEKRPGRISRLQTNTRLFFDEAQAAGLNTGNACRGAAMVPIIAGGISRVGHLMQRVFERGVNASPIIYPGVPINAGRLRFFLTSEHSSDQIREAVRLTKEELDQMSGVRVYPARRDSGRMVTASKGLVQGG
jgi:7-keto-8-aminopelargonate synthetase-like enzyme